MLMKPYCPMARAAVTLAVALLCLPSIADAREDALVPSAPSAPIPYHLELEPHFVLGTAPPGAGRGSGLGGGVRASVVILRGNGKHSLAIGVGLDYGRYYGKWALSGYQDRCLHYTVGPGDLPVCTDVTVNGGQDTYVYIPIVVQWNFQLTRRFSLFGEPGLNIYYLADDGVSAVPALYVGGRIRLSDRIALTLRIGYPMFGIGLSILL